MGSMLVEEAVRFPTACVCGNQQGPFVDTGMANAGGHVYLCERCTKAHARLIGWHEAAVYSMLTGKLTALEARVEELTGLLEYERNHKLVDAHEFAQVVMRQSA